MKVDQGAIDTDKLNIAYCHIIAPVAGRVGLRLVDPGNYVQAGSATGLVILTQLEPISVIFTIAEDNVPEVMAQLTAGATLPVDAYDRTNVTKLASGKVETIDNVIDPTTGMVKIRALFANPKSALFPSQFVNARLLVDTLHQVTRVPVAAVQQGAPGAFVYVINANDTVAVRTVKLGVTDGPLQQVLSGLSPGDRVVTDGTDRLRDGAKVTVPVAQGTGQAATTGTTPAPGTPATGSGRHRGQQAGQSAEASGQGTPASQGQQGAPTPSGQQGTQRAQTPQGQ